MKKLFDKKRSFLACFLLLLVMVGTFGFISMRATHSAKASSEDPTCTESKPCNKAYLAEPTDILPTSLNPGQAFTIKITMQNAGTTTWTRRGGYALESQLSQNNLDWGINRIPLPSPYQVEPQGTVTFTLNLTAPATPGCYALAWQMVQAGVERFGVITQYNTVTGQVYYTQVGGDGHSHC